LAQSPTPNPIGVAVDYSQSPPTRLVIPKIGLDTGVKEVTVKLGSWQVADYAAGHNLGTAYPGEIGNMVLAGHRDIRGNVFLRLPELQAGDQFQVYSNAGVFRYQVTSVFEVDPNDISVMNPSPESIATLITCTPLGTSARRLIVRAKLVN
jgi:sortase A